MVYNILLHKFFGLLPSYVLEHYNTLRFGDRFNPRLQACCLQNNCAGMIIYFVCKLRSSISSYRLPGEYYGITALRVATAS
jgi:hypothetical protein